MMAEHLQEHLDELGLLESMFSSPGEFEIEDSTSYKQAEGYLQQICPQPPNSLTCRLFIPISAQQDSDEEEEEAERIPPASPYSVTIAIRLPPRYPDCYPEIHASANELKRRPQDDLNSDLQAFMKTLPLGEACLLQLVEWTRDNAYTYFPVPCNKRPELELDMKNDVDSHFCRMWLYMHHIYSKTKRRNILSLSSDLDLTGFCLPGKPGVVCVEGSVRNTREFYSVLRSWNWKSIACRLREVEPSPDSPTHHRIQGFGEISFDMHGHRGNHMDMGQFLDYLRKHGLQHVFKELFGVEGHSAD